VYSQSGGGDGVVGAVVQNGEAMKPRLEKCVADGRVLVCERDGVAALLEVVQFHEIF
jgi:hypothetical protein